MLARRTPDTRFVLALVILAFLAALAWWWSLRAGRIEASLSPTPVPGGAPVAPVPAAPTAGAAR